MKRILALSAILIGLILQPGLKGMASENITFQETALNPDGSACEIHLDNQNYLWITEYWAGEVWRVKADGSSSDSFAVGGYPSDALPDNQGWVWWADGQELHRLNASSGAHEMWDTSAHSSWLWGLAFDNQGNLWITDSSETPNVFKFDPSTFTLCTYATPLAGETNGQGFYPAIQGDYLWLGDAVNGRLMRLDTKSPQWSSWNLPAGSAPFQVTMDTNRYVWYIDNALNQLGKLDIFENRLLVYTLPDGQTLPKMMTVNNGKVWYTGQNPPSIGSLDPSQEPGTQQPTWISISTPAWSCSPTPLVKMNLAAVSPQSRQPAWQSARYTIRSAPTGWSIYELPEYSQPYGIVTVTTGENQKGYVVDGGRQKLIMMQGWTGKYFLNLPLLEKLFLGK